MRISGFGGILFTTAGLGEEVVRARRHLQVKPYSFDFSGKLLGITQALGVPRSAGLALNAEVSSIDLSLYIDSYSINTRALLVACSTSSGLGSFSP